MRVKINIDTASKAIRLANIASKLDGKILIKDNNGLCVNAKSIIGCLYSLEYNEIWLESEKDIYSKIEEFVEV